MIFLPTSDHADFLNVLRIIVNNTETVDSYYVDYTTTTDAHNIRVVDAEYLTRERVDHVLTTLAELDAIVRQGGLGGDSTVGELSRINVERASYLAAAIREVLTEGVKPGATPEQIEAAQAVGLKARERMDAARRKAAGQ